MKKVTAILIAVIMIASVIPLAAQAAPSADQWLCSSADIQMNWVFAAGDTSQYVQFTFNANGWFDKCVLMLYYVNSTTSVKLKLLTAGEELENITVNYGGSSSGIAAEAPTVNFSKTYGPGTYMVRIESTGTLAAFGSASKAQTDVDVTQQVNNYNPGLPQYPAFVLKGAEPIDLEFSRASVTIRTGGKMEVNFKADAGIFCPGRYTDPYVTFNGSQDHVSGAVIGSDLVFSFTDIEPDHMKDNISATLHATLNNNEYTAQLSYSIVDYCKSAYAAPSASAELKTLLADMLNYGAMAQKFEDPAIADSALVTADAELAGLLACATSTDPVLNAAPASLFTAISGGNARKVKWTGAGLRLEDEISVRLKFTKVSGYETCVPDSVKYTIAGDAAEYTASVTETGNGSYVCYLMIPVNAMRSAVSATVYEGNVPVSNTVTYSAEYYAAAKKDVSERGLGELVKAMMKYGDAAEAYQPAA